MLARKLTHLIFAAVSIVFLMATVPVKADTIAVEYGNTLKNVLIITQADNYVDYMTYAKGGWVEKERLYIGENTANTNVTITVSSDAEKKKLAETWKQQATKVVVERNFGPTLTLAGVAISYPLPENISYIMGSPDVKKGYQLYVGKDANTASPVFLREVQALELMKNGKTVKIQWNNAETSEGDLLTSWTYGDDAGAPVLLSGLDVNSDSFVELPLSGIRKITITCEQTIHCSGNPSHSFLTAPTTWKFCPICGKPLAF